MDIKRSGSQPSGKGPAEWFTGAVRIDPLLSPPDPARVAGALVTFEPGARTAWHTHPLGQTPDRHDRLRPGPTRGRPGRGDPSWRRRLLCAGGEALARGGADHGDEPYRHPGKARRQGGRLDGEGQRRAVPGLSSRLDRQDSSSWWQAPRRPPRDRERTRPRSRYRGSDTRRTSSLEPAGFPDRQRDRRRYRQADLTPVNALKQQA